LAKGGKKEGAPPEEKSSDGNEGTLLTKCARSKVLQEQNTRYFQNGL